MHIHFQDFTVQSRKQKHLFCAIYENFTILLRNKVFNSSAGEKRHCLSIPVMEKTDLRLGNQPGNKESFELLLEQASGLCYGLKKTGQSFCTA